MSEEAPVRREPPRWLEPAVALIALSAIAGAVWTGLSVRAERAEDKAERTALATGREAAVAFTSYDHQHLDEDLARVTDMSTGDFREQFTAALGTLTAAIEEAQGVSVGEVTDAGIVRADDASAVVMAAVDATVTNTSTKQPSLRRYRLQITLTRDGDGWLISDISPVS
ncbi:hypothetical protein GCM10025786_15460 [Nocardioides caeni]